MKKLLTFFFLLFIASFSQAQWIFENFDNAVGPLFLDPPVLNSNFYTDGDSAYMNLTNDPDNFEGTGSMKVDYRVEAAEGWGGYTVRTTYVGSAVDSVPYLDLSTGTEIKLRYKVVAPADTTQDGDAFMELKLAEFDDAGLRDLWLHHMAINLFDASGTWQEITIPLERNDDNTLGFSLQFGGGDGEMQLDKIKGFEMSVVYITAGNAGDPPVLTGTVLLDAAELVGNRYNPFQTFDNAATGTFTTDYMDWAGAGASSIAFSNNTTDFIEGTGSLQMDYTVNASQDWGGYLNFTDTTFHPDSNFAERTALVFWVKNVSPFVGTTPERVTMRFFLMENSTGVNEDWVCEVPVNFEQAGDWTRYYLPLKQDTVWTDGGGHVRFPQTGFAQPWWSITGDNTFNPDFVTGYKIELSAGGSPEYGDVGETFTGTLLFDVIQQSGFQFADKTAPDPPSVNVVTSTYYNVVAWTDVPGESGEKYYVYFSEQPFTDVNSVFQAYQLEPIPHGTENYTHALRSANTDKNKTYYYAVTCKDFAGNVSEPSFFGPVTNLAKGVPTVSITPPTSFVADGDLGEWSDAQPSFLMQSALGTATVVLNVDGDADCSADVKVAIDNTYLYVMIDVTDDVVEWDDAALTYENDAPDIYIGLYNYTQSHVAYWRGNTPDYHLRFGKHFIRSDESGSQCDEMIANGSENYYWGEKFPSGYVVEARIPLDSLASKRNSNITSTDVINWKVGDKIPFDIAINDNDGVDTNDPPDGITNREGMIFYGVNNKDNGWQNVNSWTYTWISDDVTAVDENPGVVHTYNLEQNYPNPFNPTTKIQYSIAESGLVTVKVYDLLGRQVAELVNEEQAVGSYTVDFNAQKLATGVYVYRIESGKFQATKKMLLIK
jgi:hypothetical protein